MNRPCGSLWRVRPEARAIKSQGDAGLPRQENAPLLRRVFDAKGPRPRDCLIARAREGGFSLSDLAPSRRAELCVFRRAASGFLPRLAPYAALPGLRCLVCRLRRGMALLVSRAPPLTSLCRSRVAASFTDSTYTLNHIIRCRLNSWIRLALQNERRVEFSAIVHAPD